VKISPPRWHGLNERVGVESPLDCDRRISINTSNGEEESHDLANNSQGIWQIEHGQAWGAKCIAMN
jgi:hypothetical protein